MNSAPGDGIGLAVFVKTPGYSEVKTRLAAGIGADAATEFYSLSAAAVAAVVGAASEALPLTPYWAVAEAGALNDPTWTDLPRLPQGNGDLGNRMRTVCDTLLTTHGRALLLGADAPQIQVAYLREAVTALDSHNHVLGPAADGGFWLFGTRTPVPDAAWDATPWSCSDTAERFVAGLQPGSVARLRTLRDVDTADDLPPLLAALDTLPDPRPEQHRLNDWLRRAGS